MGATIVECSLGSSGQDDAKHLAAHLMNVANVTDRKDRALR